MVVEPTVESPQRLFERSLWLMPAAYAVHIVEEYFGWAGPPFVVWVRDTLGGIAMDRLPWLLANLATLAILALAIGVTVRLRKPLLSFLLLAYCSGHLFWNALFHLGATAWFGTYSPGAITGALIYLPVMAAVYRRAFGAGALRPASFAAALAIALAGHAVVVWGLLGFPVRA